MRSKFVLGIAVGLLLTFGAATAHAANQLSNPGFENGLSDWNDLFGNPSQLSTTTFRSGAMSATKSVGPVSGQDYWSQIYQEETVAGGNPIYASAYLKTTFHPAATAKGGLMAQFYNSSGTLVGATVTAPDVGGTTNWRRVEISTTAPTGAVKVRLSAFLWAAQGDTQSQSGAVFFDDLFLDRVARAVQPQLSLRNRGFENGLHDWKDLFGFPSFLSTSPKRSGTYAAGKQVQSVSSQDYWSQIYQEVAVSPGRTGIASMYVRTLCAVNAAARAGVLVQFLNASGGVISEKTSATIGGQTAWRQLSVSWTAPAGTSKIRVSGFIFAPQGDVPSVGGRAFYDDTALTIQ